MTTLHHFDHLPMDFPILDEKMDMASSPFRQVEVEDLDLEFDQMENQHPMLPSDNPMDDVSEFGSKIDEPMHGDDAELLEDANMQDDVHLVKDLDMSEEALDHQGQDDEILYDEEEDTAIPDTASQQATGQSEVDHADEDLFDFDDTDHIDISTVDHQHIPDTATANNDDLETFHPQEEEGFTNDDHPADEPLSTNTDQPTSIDTQQQAQDAAHEVSEQQPEDQHESPLSDDHPEEQLLSEAHDNSLQEHSENVENVDNVERIQNSESAEVLSGEAPVEPEATTSIDISSLAPHFATVKFNGVDYQLFSDEEPAVNQPFPLSDTSLLFEPLDKLLETCRRRLSNHVEEHLDEVTMAVPAFDLYYCEDSKYASQRSLADILQLYVMLKQNAKAEFIEPLNCTLTIRTCAATQYSWLVEEASKQTPYDAIASPEANEQVLQESSEAVGVVEAGANLTSQNDVVEAEVEAEAAGVTSGEAFENADGWNEEINEEPQSEEPDQAPANDADDSTVPEDDVVDGAHTHMAEDGAGESADHTSQETVQNPDFFEEAFEDTDAATEAEKTEEALEREEDRHALEETAERLEAGRELKSEDLIEDEEQLDFGDEPEPLKHVAEERDIAQEDEDLFINPDDPLESNEDPDALLEGRTGEAISTAAISESLPANGHNASNGSDAATQPITPSKVKSSKRKADDEDKDFLELDFDTPEPKRRRPSPT